VCHDNGKGRGDNINQGEYGGLGEKHTLPTPHAVYGRKTEWIDIIRSSVGLEMLLLRLHCVSGAVWLTFGGGTARRRR
jgi:hypothetical protein